MAIVNVDPNNPVEIIVSKLTASVPDNKIRTFAIVSAGDTNLLSGVSKIITLSEIETVFDTTTEDYKSTETYVVLNSYFGNNNLGSVLVLETGEIVDDKPATNIGVLDTYIKAGIKLAYGYYLPKVFASVLADIKSLVTLYSSNTSATVFVIETKANIDPETDSEYLNLAGLKAYFGVIPSELTTESSAGAIMGVMGSSIYNLSQTVPMTQLQYKNIIGIKPRTFNTDLRMKIINSSLNYVGSFDNSTVIMNGRVGNNDAWDYWYAFDFVANNVQNALLNAIKNGSNVPSASIRFSQNGIDALKLVIINQLNNGKANGTITDFAQGLTPAGEYIGLNDIGSIGYYAYKSAYPDKYQQELYDGFYAFITIGRFIRKVIFAVTID